MGERHRERRRIFTGTYRGSSADFRQTEVQDFDRAIAALNHPNICQIYDVGPDYLVMELIEGPTLQERIKEGAIPLDEALRITRQISEALAAAHCRKFTTQVVFCKPRPFSGSDFVSAVAQ